MSDVRSDPMPFGSAPIRVNVPGKMLFSKERMLVVLDQVLARLGCPNCHSGFDIRFHREEELFALEDAAGKIRLLGHGERF